MTKVAGKPRLVAEYLAVRILYAVLMFIPFPVAAWIGRRIGWLWRLVDRRHRERARHQVMERLGLSGSEADLFVRENFRHYGLVLAEFCRLGKATSEEIGERIDFGGYDQMTRDLLAEGNGLVVVTGHLGNWEWANSIAKTLGQTGGSIARPLDNPYVNEMTRTIRERNGFHILDKQGAIRGALKCLKKGEVLAVLIDQDAGPLGMMSPFLGKPASTITIPVELAIRVGSPMIAAALLRDGAAGRFRMIHSPEPLRPRPDANVEEETKRLVDALNDELGRLIMQAPEQWFWVHRRWKSRDGRTG